MKTRELGQAERVGKRQIALGAAVLLVLAIALGVAVGPRPQSGTSSPAPPATGAVVDGIPCGGEEFTIHQHLQLKIRIAGRVTTVPAGVGVVEPTRVRLGSIETAQCFYWLHTHDSSGMIHVEAPAPLPFTLGQFFDIWGEPLSPGGLLGQTGTLVAQVNGTPHTGDPRSILLTDGEVIGLDLEPGSGPLPWLRRYLP